MSIRGVVKKIFPEKFYPYLQIPYRMGWAIRRKFLRKKNANKTITNAKKYLPYYRDELSREILNDLIEGILTPNDDIFIRRAKKEGWRFSGPSGIDCKKYSGALVIYDSEKKAQNLKELFSLCDWPKNYRFMKLREFLKDGSTDKKELIITALTDWDIIRLKKYVAGKNITNEIIHGAVAMREDEQYLDVFSPVDNEIVIDAGAFDGATALRFLEWGGEKIKHVYSFELDPANFTKCQENLKAVSEKVTLIQKGTWDSDEIIYLDGGGSGGAGSHMSSDGTIKAELTSIDSVVKDEPVTFIKMDVEGAELKSLMGARNTILKNRPRLAICVYHKMQDIYEIPEYILSLVPEYKFYLRHYASNGYETVLYASCE